MILVLEIVFSSQKVFYSKQVNLTYLVVALSLILGLPTKLRFYEIKCYSKV